MQKQRIYITSLLLLLFLGARAAWVEDYGLDFSTYRGFPFYVMGYASEWVDGEMTDYVADYRYESVDNSENTSDVIHYQEEDTSIEWIQLLVNGDAEKDWDEIVPYGAATPYYSEDYNYKVCAWGKEYKAFMTEDGFPENNPYPCPIEDDGTGNRVFVVHAKKVEAADFAEDGQYYERLGGGDVNAMEWMNQFWIESPHEWKGGERVRIKFRYKASQNTDAVNTQCHAQAPGYYLHWTAIGDITFTTEWQEFDKVVSLPTEGAGMWSVAFNLGSNNNYMKNIDFYFDDLSWEEMGLEHGYFVAGCNTRTGLEYDFDNAIKFDIYDEISPVYSATIGEKGKEDTYVDQIMISTVRGNDSAFMAATLKPKEPVVDDPTKMYEYDEKAQAKITLPGEGVWEVKITDEGIWFRMIEGKIKEKVTIVPNKSRLVVHAVERDWLGTDDDGNPREAEVGSGQTWDNQMWICANRSLSKGEDTYIEFKYKAAKAAKVTTQCHTTPTNYLHWVAIGDIQFAEDWQTVGTKFTIPEEGDGMQSIAFNLSEIKEANDYYIKDVIWCTGSKENSYESLIDMTGDKHLWWHIIGGVLTNGGVVETCDEVRINVNDNIVTMTCETEGATVYYTLDGKTPTTASSKYTTQITLTHNCIIKAFAVKEDMTDSPVTSYEVNTFTTATPTFSQSGNKLTITCSTYGATIYYTIGGGVPTNASAKYTDAITRTDNRVVKAIAYAENFNPSAVASYTPNPVTCQQVVISVNGTTATMTCGTDGATIYYTLDGTTPTTSSSRYTAPITLAHNCTIKAIAVKENMNDSPVASYEFNDFTVATPTISQDGDKLIISCVTDHSAIYYTIGGEEPTNASTKYENFITITDNRIVKAIAYKENFNPSEITSYTPTSFTCAPVTISYDGRYVALASTTEGTTIHYTTDGSVPTKTSTVYTEPFDAGGIVTVNAIAVKDYLNDSECTAEAFCYYNNGIVAWINDATATEKAFKHYGKESLAAIVWNVSSTFPKDLISGIDNPNLLFYTKSAEYAPSTVKNVVVSGNAERITLQDVEGNGNFFVPEQFEARTISYTHNYSLPTIIKENAGWETIALPFEVQKYTHQTNGEIVPFAKYKTGDRPFWLYSLEQNGFVEADGIKANTPYIISMPNNDEYADEYILAGNVTFSAENCDVPVTKAAVKVYRDRKFVPTTLKVEISDRVMAINKEVYDSHYAGSLFVHNLCDVQPFEAYITASDAANLPRAVSIAELFDVSNGIADLPSVISHQPAVIRVYDLRGICVKIVEDSANITKDLPKGIYIVNKRKIVVQ